MLTNAAGWKDIKFRSIHTSNFASLDVVLIYIYIYRNQHQPRKISKKQNIYGWLVDTKGKRYASICVSLIYFVFNFGNHHLLFSTCVPPLIFSHNWSWQYCIGMRMNCHPKIKSQSTILICCSYFLYFILFLIYIFK